MREPPGQINKKAHPKPAYALPPNSHQKTVRDAGVGLIGFVLLLKFYFYVVCGQGDQGGQEGGEAGGEVVFVQLLEVGQQGADLLGDYLF